MHRCDLLCTMTAVQSHSVLNTNFLKIALIQHTFTCVLPMPKPEGEGVGAVFEGQCLWRTPMLYDQQLGALLLLQRLVEHFAASAFSLDHTRSADGVRMVVPACAAAIADCVMRQLATDKPSRVCLHLRGDVGALPPGTPAGGGDTGAATKEAGATTAGDAAAPPVAVAGLSHVRVSVQVEMKRYSRPTPPAALARVAKPPRHTWSLSGAKVVQTVKSEPL